MHRLRPRSVAWVGALSALRLRRTHLRQTWLPMLLRNAIFLLLHQLGLVTHACSSGPGALVRAVQCAPFHRCAAHDEVMTQEVVADWVENELLGGPDPFADHSGKVPVPWSRRGLHAGITSPNLRWSG